tara:strand:+ start:5128 stop:5454 length:327 start_codon:yes stop_codon:yes gene_type:complete
MPYKEKPIEKLYYTIGEVANKFNVNISLIRFWEKEFEILKPKKNKKGNRLFTKKDLNNLETIYHLVKERGFKIEGAKKMLKNNIKDDIDIISKLKKIKNFLQKLKDEL